MKNARPTEVKTSAADTAQSRFLTTTNQASPHVALLMSSREIAELTGKDHKNVLADIRDMLDAIGQTSADFSANLPDAYGRLQPVFVLPKDLTITLVAGYNVVMRHRIVTRLQELESQAAQPVAIPQTLPEALRLAADLAEKAAQTEAQLAVVQPKAKALDRISGAEGSRCITDSAKVLGIAPRKLFARLSEWKWIYRRVGAAGWGGYQDRIHSGHLEHRVTVVDRQDGSEKAVAQVLVTPKGLAKLAELLSRPTGEA